jgi:hypothetical protein
MDLHHRRQAICLVARFAGMFARATKRLRNTIRSPRYGGANSPVTETVAEEPRGVRELNRAGPKDAARQFAHGPQGPLRVVHPKRLKIIIEEDR